MPCAALCYTARCTHLSVGEATPPLAITLMQCAPFRSSSLAARRTCRCCGMPRRVGTPAYCLTATAATGLLLQIPACMDCHMQRRTSGTPSHTLPMPRSAAPQAQKSCPLHSSTLPHIL